MEDRKIATFYAGPYVGEFGWELCWWNPLVRYHAEQYDHVIIAAPHGSRYLYEFADEFIPLDAIGVSYCDGNLKDDPPIVIADQTLSPKTEFAKHPNEPDRISTQRKWRLLAPPNPTQIADVLCSFRPPKIVKNRAVPGKEYPIKKCQQIVDFIRKHDLSVACFGGFDNYCPQGAIDLRGQPLEGQCSALAGAKCAIGPSSGTMHLASLCGCPHVTWIASIHHTLKKRYQKLWNPFNTPVKFIGHGRLPSPGEVLQHVEVLLARSIK